MRVTLARTPGIAADLILWWVEFYTTGLSGASRERRLGQIRSDLWEHYSDRTEQGASPAVIGLESLSRAARGAAADLLWRFQMEGPQLQLNIPIERIGGACLLVLVAAAMLSLNVAGYDPKIEGFEGELRRLASIKAWQTGMYTAFQVLSGIGMLAGAVVLYLALKRYSTAPVILAAVALASAGLLTLVTSALYSTAAALADEYIAATPEHRDAVLPVARAFVLMLNAAVPVTGVMLALGIYGFAFITRRYHVVPQWLRFAAGGSAVALGIAMVTGLAFDSDITWLFVMTGFFLLLLWLAVAGGWLLLAGSNGSSDDQKPSALGDLLAPDPAHEQKRNQLWTPNRWLIGMIGAFLCLSLVVSVVFGLGGFIIITFPATVVLIAAFVYATVRRNSFPESRPDWRSEGR